MKLKMKLKLRCRLTFRMTLRSQSSLLSEILMRFELSFYFTYSIECERWIEKLFHSSTCYGNLKIWNLVISYNTMEWIPLYSIWQFGFNFLRIYQNIFFQLLNKFHITNLTLNTLAMFVLFPSCSEWMRSCVVGLFNIVRFEDCMHLIQNFLLFKSVEIPMG